MANSTTPPPDADELRAGADISGNVLPPWAWRFVGVLVVVALVALVGPDLLSHGPTAAPAPHRSASPTQDTGLRVPSRPVLPLIWATRGDGVGTPFAARALRRARALRPGVDRLLWVGTVDGRDRVAFLSLSPSPETAVVEGVRVAALRVPAGGRLAAARLQPAGSVRGPDGRVGAAWSGADGRTRLVVLGRPGPLTVDVSGVISYRRDGSIGRRWRPVSSPTGAIVTDLGPRTDPVIVVRPFRKTPGENFLVTVGGTTAPSALQIKGANAPSYAGPDRRILRRGVAEAVSTLVDVRRTAAKVVWSGVIDVGPRGPDQVRLSGRGALVRLRRDDGPVFQAFVFTDNLGALNPSYTAYAVPWDAGDRLPYVFSTYDEGTPLLVINPSGAGTVTVDVRFAARATVRTDEHGIGILDEDSTHSLGYGGSRVVVRDPRGRQVLSSRLVDLTTVDPYGLYL